MGGQGQHDGLAVKGQKHPLSGEDGNENPGPGFNSVTHQSAEINSSSLSKKRTGYFPSLKISNYPAANAYKISPSFQSKQDFSKGTSSTFQQPIARKSEKIPTPARHYTTKDSLIEVSPEGIASCFKSKTSCLTRMDRFNPEPAEILFDSAPSIPPRKDPPLPGQCDLVDYKGSLKQDCSTDRAQITGRVPSAR
ncbi:O(6)-methylguanine-induced apoptosis 2 [Egretta garzetta]|uniref:O(6)-methylguanine-induced apoptosis 2 n=1 Tax=Egretta garzetta TaxID=188379 RepID=UPI00051F13C9|nr:O(6)-methylguanine-induced apoptosis 2 [Egretta garzetta]